MNAPFFLCVLVACLGASTSNPTNDKSDQPKLWALLVAGSNGWDNYRHQADVCHAYHVLHAHGIPDENIVVMMYDDIANNQQNPTPGIIINHPNGSDVYKGVLKDYVGEDVTPENFINILTGNKDAMKNIGSGKVIESGPNDHVFVNFVDHGATGILAFPVREVTVKELHSALKKMFKEKRYAKLVLYIEACESGSMFRNVLENNINVFATTASDYDESSYACYLDEKRGTYLGDRYSVSWMEDSDKEDIETETLETQYEIVKKETNESHVMQYGDMTISDLVVGEFQGEEAAPPKIMPKVPYQRGVPSWEVPLDLLQRKLTAAQTEDEKQQIRAKIDDLLDKRGYLETIIKKIVTRVSASRENGEKLMLARPEQLTKLDCHHKLVKAFSRHCFDFGKNTYALKYAYILANMCENGLDVDETIRTMRQVCKSVEINGKID